MEDSSRRLFHSVFYYTSAFIARALLMLGGRVKCVSFSPLPSGSFVMVSNHISHFDPPLLSSWFPRKIDWIAMKELFHSQWTRKIFQWLDVIPIDRKGEDRQAFRKALKRLTQESVIGIFPEGGLRDGERSILSGAPMRPGAVVLALHAKCPIVPVVILGSERLYNFKNWLPWRSARIYIAWGPPIFPLQGMSSAISRKKMNDALAAALISLKDRLVAHCGLNDGDLPHSPQQRMAEA